MSLLEDKALRLNLISMVILVITAIYDFIFRGGEKLFRIGLMAATLWIMYFVYKKTFLRKSRISFYLIFVKDASTNKLSYYSCRWYIR